MQRMRGTEPPTMIVFWHLAGHNTLAAEHARGKRGCAGEAAQPLRHRMHCRPGQYVYPIPVNMCCTLPLERPHSGGSFGQRAEPSSEGVFARHHPDQLIKDRQ